MPALEDFRRSKRFAVCVDSDGCAMDTMNIKHIRCFGPCMVEEWGLEAWREAILERWNEINLYSGTRGINRFKGLAMALAEINGKYTPIDGIEQLTAWADTAPELSNDAVAGKAGDHPIFEKALRWSRAVNAAIEALPREEVRPFAHVKEALAAAGREADVVVVSSANPEAVRDEWARFELLPHVDLLCTQEMGKPEGLNADEVEGLKSRSAVEPEEWPFDWKDGKLTLRAELGVNDVYGFVIR